MSNDQRPQRMKIVAGSIPNPVPQRRATDRRDADAALAPPAANDPAADVAAADPAMLVGDDGAAAAEPKRALFSPLLIALFLGGAFAAALLVSLLSSFA